MFTNLNANFLDLLISLVLLSVMLRYLKFCWVQVMQPCSVGTFCFVQHSLVPNAAHDGYRLNFFFLHVVYIYNVNITCAYWLPQYPVSP